MDEKQAYEMFKKYLVHKCPECEAPVGKLCNKGGVWIHLERMKLDPDFVP